MIASMNNFPIDFAAERYAGREITIAIDSSKRNTAISIGNKQCVMEDIIELNGKNDGTKTEDVLNLCKAQRIFLKQLLRGSKPVIVGIEDIITVDHGKKESGISYHMSRFKITAVFMSLITFFQDEFSITPELVNNWTWKTAVLPEEFRSKGIGKGSLAYFKSINSPLAFYSDDATDSVCILKYLQKKYGFKDVFYITEPELEQKEGYACLYEVKSEYLNLDAKWFEVSLELTLEENITVMLNHQGNQKFAMAKIPAAYPTISEIYKYAKGRFQRYENEVLLVTKRRQV